VIWWRVKLWKRILNRRLAAKKSACLWAGRCWSGLITYAAAAAWPTFFNPACFSFKSVKLPPLLAAAVIREKYVFPFGKYDLA